MTPKNGNGRWLFWAVITLFGIIYTMVGINTTNISANEEKSRDRDADMNEHTNRGMVEQMTLNTEMKVQLTEIASAVKYIKEEIDHGRTR